MNIFKRAAQLKLHFHTPKGTVFTQDLYDLSVKALDQMAVHLHQALEAKPTSSFLSEAPKADPIEQLRLEILLDIIQDKEEAKAKAEAIASKRVKNKRVRELIARKRDAALEKLEVEALEALLEEE